MIILLAKVVDLSLFEALSKICFERIDYEKEKFSLEAETETVAFSKHLNHDFGIFDRIYSR